MTDSFDTNPPPPADINEDAGQGANLLRALQRLRKHWLLILAITATISSVVAFYTLGQKRIYQASATVLFDPNPPRPLGRSVDTVVDMSSGSYWNNKEYYETQYQLMRSRRVALSVVEDLGLHNDLEFIANLPPGDKVRGLQPTTAEVAASILMSRLAVEPVRSSRLAVLRYQDANPERAQRIVAAMVNTYVDKNLEDVQSSTGSAVEWLNNQLDNLKGNLDSSELALHEYKLEKNILSADLEDQSNMLREQMRQFSDALTAVRIKRAELTARHAELMKIPDDDPTTLPATELLQSGLLSNLRNAYVEAKRERDALAAVGRGENHPELRAAESRVVNARSALLSEVKNVRGAVSRDLAIVRRQEAALGGLYQAAKKDAIDLNLLGIEYNRLSRTKGNNEKLYSVVMERAKEGDLTRMLQVNNIKVVDLPQRPNAPIYPRVPRNLALGFALGAFLGVGVAFLRELFDRTVKVQADIEGVLGLTFLGLMPAVGKNGKNKNAYYGRGRGRRRTVEKATGSPELIVHESPLSGPAEAARNIRTNLQFMSPDRPLRVVVVTSAGPSEGKTTVATGLAIAIAQAGQKVILVDCDLRRPRVHRVFGKSSDRGVTTAVMDRGVLTDELLATDIPNLSVLPAGPIPPNPAELLQSDRFKQLLATLRESYDRVVIDSPPIVPVTDAAVLSTQVDGTVIVVRAFATARDLVLEAKRSIRGVGGRVIGAVLNAVDFRRSEYSGYRYEYYRKGGYYRAQAEDGAETTAESVEK
jgi:capsular exopolysaccharide synthesis family protein